MKSETTPGNRLPLPAAVPGAHLLYRANSPALCEHDIAILAQAVQDYVYDVGLDATQIELLTEEDQARLFSPEAVAARERLVQALGWAHLQPNQRGIIFCEWAPPHVDDYYVGKAFVSLVLHTGPEPYVIQTFHTAQRAPEDRTPGPVTLTQTTRLLNVGDLFVLDPCTPHMAAPVRSNNEALLVLLQATWLDEDLTQRNALLARFEPHADNQEADVAFM